MRSQDVTRRGFIAAAAALVACSSKSGPDSSAAPKESEIPLPPPSATAREMPMSTLGKTGERVSRIGLGGAHIGKQKDEQESIRIIRTAIDRGVTFLDNCWDYNDGKSEERMGKALRDGYRDKAFLMTKLDGRTKASAAAQLDQSLQRLQTDRIDLVQVHEVIRTDDPDRVFAPGGAIDAYVEGKKAGKLRYIGFTGHKDPDIHLAMLAAADRAGFVFDAVQMPLNVLDAHYNSFEKKVLPVLVERGIGVLHMKSMGSGDILESKVVTARECLRYALSLPASVLVTGCDSIGILEQAIDVVLTFQPMTDAEKKELLDRTREVAMKGSFEKFKTSDKYDGTAKNPHWLEEARL